MVDRQRSQNQTCAGVFGPTHEGGTSLRAPCYISYFGYFYFAYATALGGCTALRRLYEK
jgi:hypothetical protein